MQMKGKIWTRISRSVSILGREVSANGQGMVTGWEAQAEQAIFFDEGQFSREPGGGLRGVSAPRHWWTGSASTGIPSGWLR
jgi:hypothetical protein